MKIRHREYRVGEDILLAADESGPNDSRGAAHQFNCVTVDKQTGALALSKCTDEDQIWTYQVIGAQKGIFTTPDPTKPTANLCLVDAGSTAANTATETGTEDFKSAKLVPCTDETFVAAVKSCAGPGVFSIIRSTQKVKRYDDKFIAETLEEERDKAYSTIVNITQTTDKRCLSLPDDEKDNRVGFKACDASDNAEQFFFFVGNEPTTPATPQKAESAGGVDAAWAETKNFFEEDPNRAIFVSLIAGPTVLLLGGMAYRYQKFNYSSYAIRIEEEGLKPKRFGGMYKYWVTDKNVSITQSFKKVARLDYTVSPTQLIDNAQNPIEAYQLRNGAGEITYVIADGATGPFTHNGTQLKAEDTKTISTLDNEINRYLTVGPPPGSKMAQDFTNLQQNLANMRTNLTLRGQADEPTNLNLRPYDKVSEGKAWVLADVGGQRKWVEAELQNKWVPPSGKRTAAVVTAFVAAGAAIAWMAYEKSNATGLAEGTTGESKLHNLLSRANGQYRLIYERLQQETSDLALQSGI